jgi:hypothetical protein
MVSVGRAASPGRGGLRGRVDQPECRTSLSEGPLPVSVQRTVRERSGGMADNSG